MATSGLLTSLADVTDAEIGLLASRLSPPARLRLQLARAERLDELLARPVASFEAGPLLWLTRYTKTENPQYAEQGLPFLSAFPHKSYFVPLFEAFLARHQKLFIPKSRTMMTSWAAAGFATWSAQWKQSKALSIPFC